MTYYKACNDSKYTVCNELYTPDELKCKFRILADAIAAKKDVISITIQSQYAPEIKTLVRFEKCSISVHKTFRSFGCRFAV